MKIPCNYCKGLGKTDKCTYCGGSGWKSDDSYSSFECPFCKRGHAYERNCDWCKGTGEKEVPDTFEI